MKINDLIYRKHITTEIPTKLRRSQKTIFWRIHKLVVIKKDGRILGWYGKRFPKLAQEIIDEE